jgi:anaerobic magnesium-protoporphyrin IX monomethyl ester cyclase
MRPMKVLFVYTDINVRGGALSYQFGIGQLSAVLKQHGHDARQHHMFGRFDIRPLRRDLEEYQPDIVGFHLVYPQFQFVRRILGELKPWKAFVIAGGAHPTVQPEECLRDLPELDAICLGEGEYPLLELAEALRDGRPVDAIRNFWVRRVDGTIARNPLRPFIQDLDSLPFMDREICDYQAIIDSDFKTATFQFGRGCPFDCTYCSNHIIRSSQQGAYVRFRSVDGCLEEIRRVVTRYDVKTLYLNDDTFMVKKSWFEEFCDKYPKQFTLPILVNARPEQINEDVCRRLVASRCQRVTMGVEHGNENYRAEVLRRHMTNESILKAFALCKEHGFKTKAHLLVGLPHETPKLHEDTVKITVDIMPDSFNLHVFEPYPGTRLADIAYQENLIDPKRAEAAFVGQTDTVLNMPYFTRRQILHAFRRFPWRVYKHKSVLKAFPYLIYYSRWGNQIVRWLQPIKRLVRKLAMGV